MSDGLGLVWHPQLPLGWAFSIHLHRSSDGDLQGVGVLQRDGVDQCHMPLTNLTNEHAEALRRIRVRVESWLFEWLSPVPMNEIDLEFEQRKREFLSEVRSIAETRGKLMLHAVLVPLAGGDGPPIQLLLPDWAQQLFDQSGRDLADAAKRHGVPWVG